MFRSKISLAHPRNWNRPLAPGVLPAYDEALAMIRRDSNQLKKEAQLLREFIAKAEDEPKSNENALSAMRQRLNFVDVQSEVNLPRVRWKCANGMGDLSKPAHRHLSEQRWREGGTLDLLMERIHQMNVVPDVLPSLHPSLDFRITFPAHPLRGIHSRGQRKRKCQEVEPGVYLLPEQTRNPPNLYANVFHTNIQLYTLLMIDPDVPDEVNKGYQTYLHWLQPNIPLSAQTSGRIFAQPHTQYIPPHPQRGTSYHRYVIFLLPQPSATEQLCIPVVSEKDRLGFNVREFMAAHLLDGSLGGAHLWRAIWNAEVSDIYKNVLKVDEPRFGRPPKADPYAEVKRIQRYV